MVEIIAVSAGRNHTVGLKTDGTVIAVGSNEFGQLEVNDWQNVIQIAAGVFHTVGLLSDGKVIAVGSNSKGQLDVNFWSDIITISAGMHYTVALNKDGSIVGVGVLMEEERGLSGHSKVETRVDDIVGKWNLFKDMQ